MEINNWITHYGATAIFVIIFLESLGLPLPGETVLITGSLLASLHKISLWASLISAFIAASLGNIIAYFIGYYTGKKLLIRFGPFLKLTPRHLRIYEEKLKKYGFSFIFIARFIVIARQLNGIIAGSASMPFHKFFFANLLGALIWVGCWGLLPYYFKNLFF